MNPAIILPFLGVIGSGIAAVVTAVLANRGHVVEHEADSTPPEPVVVTPEEVVAAASQIAKAATNARGEPFELIPENIESWAKDAGAV
jgi:hypothetical protein